MNLIRSEYDTPRPESQTLRLWLSDQQWMSLISRIEQGRPAFPTAGAGEDRRREPRWSAAFRCVLRVTTSAGRSATYTVRSCNLSRGGMGFLHDRPMSVGAACTIAIEHPEHGGRVVGGTVAWCRAVDEVEGLHEVGLRFVQPMDMDGFPPPPPAA